VPAADAAGTGVSFPTCLQNCCLHLFQSVVSPVYRLPSVLIFVCSMPAGPTWCSLRLHAASLLALEHVCCSRSCGTRPNSCCARSTLPAQLVDPSCRACSMLLAQLVARSALHPRCNSCLSVVGGGGQHCTNVAVPVFCGWWRGLHCTNVAVPVFCGWWRGLHCINVAVHFCPVYSGGAAGACREPAAPVFRLLVARLVLQQLCCTCVLTVGAGEELVHAAKLQHLCFACGARSEAAAPAFSTMVAPA
jgi:hypothetical protein